MKQCIGLLAFALACGAPSEYLDAAGIEDDADLGEVEQPLIYLNGANTQWGAQTGSSRRACNKTSAGQVCSVPKFKKLEVARTPGAWSTDENNSMQAVVTALSTDYGGGGWVFTFVDAATTPAADKVRMIVQKTSTAGGNNGNNVQNYRDFSTASNNSMTEGGQPGAFAAPVGQYQNHGSCIAPIHRTRIVNKTGVLAEQLRLLRHAVGNDAVICMGVGTRPDSVNSYAQDTIDLVAGVGASTSGERCRAGSATEFTDLADISRATSSACAGD